MVAPRAFDAGSGITLRALTASDAGTIFAAIDRDRDFLGLWLDWVGATLSVHDTAGFVQQSLAEMTRGRSYVCTIEDHGCFAGVIGLHEIDRANRRGEIGYWLIRPATGRGVMTAAVRCLLAYAHAGERLHRIEIVVAVDNGPSRRVAERAGLQLEAVLRDRILLQGRFHDAALYVDVGGDA